MSGSGTKDDPWQLKTPPGTSEYQMWRDDAAALVFHALGLAHETAPATVSLRIRSQVEAPTGRRKIPWP